MFLKRLNVDLSPVVNVCGPIKMKGSLQNPFKCNLLIELLQLVSHNHPFSYFIQNVVPEKRIPKPLNIYLLLYTWFGAIGEDTSFEINSLQGFTLFFGVQCLISTEWYSMVRSIRQYIH